MLPDKSIGCHRTFGSLRVKSCREMVEKHNCQLYARIQGTDKNTGNPVDKYGCMDTMQNFLQIETQSVMREVAGEVSMHRKENREQSTQMAQNMVALDQNLRTMHGQNTQLALAQIKSYATQLNNEPELPFLEHQGNA
jgi:hypothetical protein